MVSRSSESALPSLKASSASVRAVGAQLRAGRHFVTLARLAGRRCRWARTARACRRGSAALPTLPRQGGPDELGIVGAGAGLVGATRAEGGRGRRREHRYCPALGEGEGGGAWAGGGGWLEAGGPWAERGGAAGRGGGRRSRALAEAWRGDRIGALARRRLSLRGGATRSQLAKSLPGFAHRAARRVRRRSGRRGRRRSRRCAPAARGGALPSSTLAISSTTALAQSRCFVRRS